MIDAIHILTSDRITQTALNKAEDLLKLFVDEFEILYGESNMVYNVHQLLHLAECVKKMDLCSLILITRWKTTLAI